VLRDLTRQYRPDDWESIVGQEALVKTLQNEIKTGSVSHAYLFEGPRGTGKTTTARVFAKHLGAQVIELDGASNNGVENIRNLRDDVMFLPTDGRKYKVYIIDEVHMLTTGAFNAFLKILEEPPQHVIFVLATTDPQKIPTTILSRCQRFSLKRISIDDINNRLQYIAEAENLNVDENDAWGILEYIARQVDGSLRDAIKLLQKCSSLDEVITVQTVVDALGSVNIQYIEQMVNHLVNRDATAALTLFNALVRDGVDIKIFIADLIDLLKGGMTDSIAKGNYNISRQMEVTEGLLSLHASLKNATQVKTVTEIQLIKICLDKQLERPHIVEDAEAAPTIQNITVNQEVAPEALTEVLDKIGRYELRISSVEMAIDQLKYKR